MKRRKTKLTTHQGQMIVYLSQYPTSGRVRLLCRECKWEGEWMGPLGAIPLVRDHGGHRTLQLAVGPDDTGLGVRRWTPDSLLPLRERRR